MAKRRRWIDDVLRNTSLDDLFGERTGLPGHDRLVHLATSADHHFRLRHGYTFRPPSPTDGSLVLGTYEPPEQPRSVVPPRGRGRPEDEDWNACVMATTALVDQLLAKRHPRQRSGRHDFVAVTIAMVWPGGWLRIADRKRLNSLRELPLAPPDEATRRRHSTKRLEDLHDRIKDTYYRVQRRNKAILKRNKATSKGR